MPVKKLNTVMMGSGVILLGSYNTTPNAPIKGRGGIFSRPSRITPAPTPVNTPAVRRVRRQPTEDILFQADVYRRNLPVIREEGVSSTEISGIDSSIREGMRETNRLARLDRQRLIDELLPKIPDMLERKLKGKGKGKAKTKRKLKGKPKIKKGK